MFGEIHRAKHNSMETHEKDLKIGLAIAARHINAYGDKYWPIFERLENDLETKKHRANRLKRRLKFAEIDDDPNLD
ncbi:hypothetical protein [Robiginitomaculum antarcticum]|uniref:hypothetical protein n=1 Tax=Robiginitomaculum antarcticum TaxID=437507 RepID=UPI000525AC8E|nr:hypothetical protein [Robiginitomaculum antarcticum]